MIIFGCIGRNQNIPYHAITECNGYDDYFIAKLLGRTHPIIIDSNKGKFSSTLLCCCHSQYVRTHDLSIVIAVALFFYF